MYDITNFMAWFLQQVVQIFTFTYYMLDNITFMNTSLLRVLLTIAVLSAFIKVTLIIPQQILPKGERTKHDREPKRTK